MCFFETWFWEKECNPYIGKSQDCWGWCVSYIHITYIMRRPKRPTKSFYQPQISNVCSNQTNLWLDIQHLQGIQIPEKIFGTSLLSCRKLQHLHLIFVYIDTIMVLSYVLPSPKNHRPKKMVRKDHHHFFRCVFLFSGGVFFPFPKNKMFFLPEKSTARSVVASKPWLTVAIMLGTLEEVCSHT